MPLSLLLADNSTGLTLIIGDNPETGRTQWRVRDNAGNTYRFELGANGTGAGGIGRAVRLTLDTVGVGGGGFHFDATHFDIATHFSRAHFQ